MPIVVKDTPPLNYPLAWNDLAVNEVYEDDQGDLVLVATKQGKEKLGLFFKTGDWLYFDFASHPIRFRGPLKAELTVAR